MARGKELEFPDLEGSMVLPSTPASRETFEQAARRSIESALVATHGKVYGDDGAAARLGIKPSTLQGKMRKYGIDRSDFVR
jgi:transcriptional regulator with GAF, ATPase, and Fis domain